MIGGDAVHRRIEHNLISRKSSGLLGFKNDVAKVTMDTSSEDEYFNYDVTLKGR